jgi:hypothetical protein
MNRGKTFGDDFDSAVDKYNAIQDVVDSLKEGKTIGK